MAEGFPLKAITVLTASLVFAACASRSKETPPQITISVEGPCPAPVVIDSPAVVIGTAPRAQQDGVNGSLTIRVVSRQANVSAYGSRVRLGYDTTIASVQFASLIPSTEFVTWPKVPAGKYWITIDGPFRRTTYARVAVRASGVDTMTLPTEHLPICDARSF